MTWPTSTVMPPVGLQFPPDEQFAYNRSGASRSQYAVLQHDVTESQTETTNSLPSHEESAYSNLITPVGAQASDASYVIQITDTVADNAKGRYLLRGYTRASVVATGALTVGTLLYAANGAITLTDTALSGGKPIARLAEAIAGAGTSTVDIQFNGWDGFSND